MRRVTKPFIRKKRQKIILNRIIKGIKVGKTVAITPKEKVILESIYGAGMILKNLKVTYKTTRVRAHYRGGSPVRAHTRRLGNKKYYLDTKSLINEYGLDYLLEHLLDTFDVESKNKIGGG
ncbi:hypothetical protein [Candidatus Pyrohabitans sp.]